MKQVEIKNMKNIWFFSDPHYGHKNICRGTTTWKVQEDGSNHGIQSLRDFDTVEEMNDTLVNNLNSCIKAEDEVFCLGDWSFGGHENIKIFRNRLNCKTIHLIFGNHDQHIEPKDSPYRGCFNSVQYVKAFSLKIDSMSSGKYGKTGFFLSHYGHRVWNQSHHGVIHLYGHSHGSLPGLGRSMDVGVDTHNLYPYHLDEIVAIMKNIKVEIVDHHNQKTN